MIFHLGKKKKRKKKKRKKGRKKEERVTGRDRFWFWA